MYRLRNISIILFSLLLINCSNECEMISKTYKSGIKKIVDVFPNCDNKENFRRYIYFENGKLQNEGTYIKNEKNGLFKRWNRKGILVEKWGTLHGESDGFIECWYDSGIKQRELFVVNGLENGEFSEWYENGQLKMNGIFENGERSGRWTTILDDGSRILRTYDKGTLNGESYEYNIDTSAVTHVHGQYIDGVEEGLWKWFNEDSLLYQTAIYSEGKLTEIKNVEIE